MRLWCKHRQHSILWFLLLLSISPIGAEDENKELPELGDDEPGCLTLDERQELSNNGNLTVFGSTCDEPSVVDLPENAVLLPLYMATPSFAWSFGKARCLCVCVVFMKMA